MPNIFLVLGYGIPKNILKDDNYNFYLKTVFNKIFSVVIKDKNAKPMIFFCGGKTDMYKPYKRNEADEMIRFFNTSIKQKPFLIQITKNWRFVSEKESLSTLENLLYSKKIIAQRKIKKANLFIFCEQTRENRIKILAKKIFHKQFRIQVTPVDFDTSANRYLSPEFIGKKERSELKHSFWALQSQENLKKHHEFFVEKIDYLRKAGPRAHVDAVKKLWEKNFKESYK
ncbi:MAG: hypothetical protein ACD_76C00045G0017 [uncultured bacterium]|nr:MAG: hypothetical protein ACD_76C00045G0017 [uncultured bacterium]HBD05225.1 hypothetical protein [Candidatus Uhrbacteria bacterium]